MQNKIKRNSIVLRFILRFETNLSIPMMYPSLHILLSNCYLPSAKKASEVADLRYRKPLFTAIELLPVNHWALFQFDRAGGLAREVEEDAVYTLHLADDAAHAGLKDIKGDVAALGRHEIGGADGAEDNGIVVGPEITHYSDGLHV